MSDDKKKTVVDITGLSLPATTLIEKISDAIGIVYEPYRISRKAKAEAKANMIKAKSEIDISDVQLRAINRWVKEEEKKQENIESIIEKTILKLKDEAKSSGMENDWIANFFDKGRLISDKEMQELWSRILAGEANSPNSFSKRTVNLLSSFNKEDAKLFTGFCKTIWYIGGSAHPVVFGDSNEMFRISFSQLAHLEDIGLIKLNALGGYKLRKQPKIIEMFYCGRNVVVEFKNQSNNELPFGKTILTNVGRELLKIIDTVFMYDKLEKEFYEHVCKKWEENQLVERVIRRN